jgi:putative tricarboxylic transport membrane protein
MAENRENLGRSATERPVVVNHTAPSRLRAFPPSKESIPELLLAAGVTAFGVLVVYETTNIRVVPIYAKVGPRIIPYIVGAGLVVLGIWLAVEVLMGRTAKPSEESEDADVSLPTDWVTVGLLAISLIVYLYLIERAGFILASSLLFYGAAFAMGSRRYLRDAAVAIILSVVVYYVFTAGLDLRLPQGVLGSARGRGSRMLRSGVQQRAGGQRAGVLAALLTPQALIPNA